MFEHKKIFILGMARSGYEAAKLLSKYDNKILITDKKQQDLEKVKELEDLGVEIHICDDPTSLLDESYDWVIKNPGIRFDHPIVLKAEELGIKVTNEVEVAYNFLPKKVEIIGITGSNGKTTTTTLTYEMLKSAGKRVHLGGNIGYPVCSLVDNCKEDDILVLEISGHQLHDFINFKTNVSVMTNLTEVHTDHFGSYDNYKYNKCLIFKGHSESDIAILNLENKDVMDGTKDIKSHKIMFSSAKEADVYIKDNSIYYFDSKVVDLKDIRLKGVHNYENIMCAISAVKQYGVSNEIIINLLKSFGGVEHRIEFVRELNKREFYNDSKATNVKSTQIALSAFNSPTIVLLGGLDRGLPFDGLTDYLNNTKEIVCYGETKFKIKEYADGINKCCKVVDTLEEAIKLAYQDSEIGDVILLSPACASWDQYENFEIRGNEFKKIVNELE
ncbi:MAG: UDP-N-acetylmuramoyl-L-alanine--D-glutamate ligase [Firmicutes bacterium]|nr:UDP-N-acetylmuramoyl-L-alanine--D-glutamate ligase [Bacillota bacterium]